MMHQYQCNGVLAGIAICRAGFPNKMVYQEFKSRYNILGAKEVAKAKNDKGAAGAVLELVKLDKDKYWLGHTKVFIRLDGGAARKQDRKCSRLASRLLACQDLEVAPDLDVRLQNMNT